MRCIFSLGNKFKTIVQIKHSDNGIGLYKMYEKQIKLCQRVGSGGFYMVMNFKEDKNEQFKAIKEIENSSSKIIEVDAAQRDEKQERFDFPMLEDIGADLKDSYIGFDNMPEIEDVYTEERRKGGKKSGDKYKNLRKKVQEICNEELKNGGFNASTLSEAVSNTIERDHSELLENFEPYQIHSEDGGGWIKGSFYDWCNAIYKKHKL